MSVSYFDFAAHQAKAVWTGADSRTWKQTELRHRLAKAIYYALIEEQNKSGPMWEDADVTTKAAYIASADQLIADILLEQNR